MDPNMIAQLIGTLGFPIVGCLYLVLRFEKVIDKNTEAVNSIGSVILNCKLKQEDK